MYNDQQQRRQRKQQQGQILPDYLLLIDDDTYYNMEILQDYLQNDMQYSNSSKSIALAGCLIRSPIKDIKLMVLFGQYGFF